MVRLFIAGVMEFYRHTGRQAFTAEDEEVKPGGNREARHIDPKLFYCLPIGVDKMYLDISWNVQGQIY